MGLFEGKVGKKVQDFIRIRQNVIRNEALEAIFKNPKKLEFNLVRILDAYVSLDFSDPYAMDQRQYYEDVLGRRFGSSYMRVVRAYKNIKFKKETCRHFLYQFQDIIGEK